MQAAEWPWPEDVVLDPAKQPRFVTSVDEFFYELQYGCHMDQVLRGSGGLSSQHGSALVIRFGQQ